MQIIGCQLDIVWENKPANHDRVRRLLETAPLRPGSLVVLPEMFATGFSMNVAAITEGESRETERFLAGLAREYGVTVLGGVVTTGADGRGRNEAVAFAPEGNEAARYCKMHPFSYGGETQHYTSGCRPSVFAVQEFTVAPFVCYDLRFPEIFRRAVKRGATLMTVIAFATFLRIAASYHASFRCSRCRTA